MGRVVILGVFVADTAYLAPRPPRLPPPRHVHTLVQTPVQTPVRALVLKLG